MSYFKVKVSFFITDGNGSNGAINVTLKAGELPTEESIAEAASALEDSLAKNGMRLMTDAEGEKYSNEHK